MWQLFLFKKEGGANQGGGANQEKYGKPFTISRLDDFIGTYFHALLGAEDQLRGAHDLALEALSLDERDDVPKFVDD